MIKTKLRTLFRKKLLEILLTEDREPVKVPQHCVNSSQRKVKNGLFGKFTKKREMGQLSAFQLTSKSSFTVDLSALGAAVFQRPL